MRVIRKIVSVFVGIMLAGTCSQAWAAEKKTSGVALVNGTEISVEDFERELTRVQRLLLGNGKPLTCSQIAKLKSEVVEGLIRRELLYQESRKMGIQVSPAEIQEELKKIQQQYASETDFTNALTVMRISPASLQAQVERALAIQQAIDKQFASKAVVSDREVWAYYDRNRDSFRQPEQIRASHILIKVDRQWEAAKKAEARQRIEKIQQQLQKGESFETLARTHSEDATASKGGDLGYVRTGQVLKAFEETLFALKPGEVSDIVETQLGYHLIKAGDRKPETAIPFENLKDRLKTLLKQEKGKEEANNYISKIREKAKIELFLPGEK